MKGVTAYGTNDGVTLQVEMANEGNAFAKGTGVISVADTNLDTSFKIDTFVSGTTIQYRVPWTDAIVPGVHAVKVRLNYGNGKITTWNGEIAIRGALQAKIAKQLKNTTVVPRSRRVSPLWIALAVLLALALFGGAFWVRRRRKRGSGPGRPGGDDARGNPVSRRWSTEPAMNRRVTALLLGVAGVILASVTAAAAVPGSRSASASATRKSATATVPNDAVTLAPAPGASAGALGQGLALTLDPGGSSRQDVVVGNTTTDLRLTVRLDAVDARAGDKGAVTFAKTGAGDGPASWLTLSDRVVVVEPGATAPVRVSIAVPSEASAGKALAGVRATVEDAVSTAGGDPPSGRPSTALLVTTTVNGEPNAQVSVVAVKPSKSGTTLEIELRNNGESPAHVAGRVRVSRPLPDDHTFQADVPGRGQCHRERAVGEALGRPPRRRRHRGRLRRRQHRVVVECHRLRRAKRRPGSPATNRRRRRRRSTTPTKDSGDETAPASGGSGGIGWNPLAVLAVLAVLAAVGWLVFEVRRGAGARVPAWYARLRADELAAPWSEGEERRRYRRPEPPPVVTPIPAPVTASTTATVTMGPPVVTVAPDTLDTLTKQLATMTDAITASTQPRIDAVTPAALEALVRQLGTLTRTVDRLIDRLDEVPLVPAAGVAPVAPDDPGGLAAELALVRAQFIPPAPQPAAATAVALAPERTHAAPRRLPTLSSRAARVREQARLAGAMTDDELETGAVPCGRVRQREPADRPPRRLRPVLVAHRGRARPLRRPPQRHRPPQPVTLMRRYQPPEWWAANARLGGAGHPTSARADRSDLGSVARQVGGVGTPKHRL